MLGEDSDDTLTGTNESDYFGGGLGAADTANDFDGNTDAACVEVEVGYRLPEPPPQP